MSLQASIDAVAKAVALTDTSDLPGLVALQELLLKLASDASDERIDRISDVSKQAAELCEHIVLREVEDTTTALRQLGEAVEFAQRVHEANERGEAPNGFRSPFEPTPQAAPAARSTTTASDWRNEVSLLREGIAALAERAATSFDDAASAAIQNLFLKTAQSSDSTGMKEAAAVCRSVAGTIQATRESKRPLPLQSVRTAMDWLSTTESIQTQAANACDADASDSTACPDDNEPVESCGADGDETISEFLTEAKEHLSNAECAALHLEKAPNDKEEINTVFRAFHTIKGVAGFMSL
ncbi:MAG: Hpt domain-containing protein, partial [Phycisphaerae bacterium]|nr:Hpt domain-containing protein [Phycisphaerae bacterium]